MQVLYTFKFIITSRAVISRQRLRNIEIVFSAIEMSREKIHFKNSYFYYLFTKTTMKSSFLSHSCPLIFFVCIIAGCKKEKALTPSGPPTLQEYQIRLQESGIKLLLRGTNFSPSAAGNTVTINGVMPQWFLLPATQLGSVFYQCRHRQNFCNGKWKYRNFYN